MANDLPDYLQAVQPVPKENRSAWYLNTAQTYASVMLWFVFWKGLAGAGGRLGGTLSAGIGVALVALLLAGLICHFLFYLVPGLLGMKTGLPLYVVGTSTYGARGGLLMPGFLMGLLQFGWIGVNAFAVSQLLYKCFGKWFALPLVERAGKLEVPIPNLTHAILAAVFAAGVALVGLKGIKYVARFASFFPLIPLAVLVILFVRTAGGVAEFTPAMLVEAGKKAAPADKAAAAQEPNKTEQTEGQETADAPAVKPDGSTKPKDPMNAIEVVICLCTVVAGFFATAGAAGADLAMNNRTGKDVQLGGLTGIALATLLAGGFAVLTVAGAYGGGMVPDKFQGNLNPLDLMNGGLLDATTANTIMILLAISSFPGGCFSAYIAATSFKTTMPKVNPLISVGLGTMVSIALAVTGLAGQLEKVFLVIGASFGPVCGAMAADYLLAGRKWAGPRAGFNPAGWISWVLGFVVGAVDFIPGAEGKVLCPPVAAFLVGFVLYYLLAKIGLESKTLEMPAAAETT